MLCAWRRQWAAFGLRCGSQWPPRNADCRGGVFAVFAKISPPTCPPYARTLSAFSLPCGALPHGVMLARAVFVATWRAAFLTPRRAPKTPHCDKNRASPRVVCAYTYNGRRAGESSRFSRRFPRPPDSPYAKIPPPPCPPYARTLSDFSPYPIPYMVFGII